MDACYLWTLAIYIEFNVFVIIQIAIKFRYSNGGHTNKTFKLNSLNSSMEIKTKLTAVV